MTILAPAIFFLCVCPWESLLKVQTQRFGGVCPQGVGKQELLLLSKHLLLG